MCIFRTLAVFFRLTLTNAGPSSTPIIALSRREQGVSFHTVSNPHFRVRAETVYIMFIGFWWQLHSHVKIVSSVPFGCVCDVLSLCIAGLQADAASVLVVCCFSVLWFLGHNDLWLYLILCFVGAVC